VVHTINQIRLEGIADQIDKKHSLANPYYTRNNLRYQQNLAKTPDDMIRLVSLLAIYDNSSDSSKLKISKEIASAARNSGHPMGYYMASTIWKYGSNESVYQEIGNPFSFFRRYNEIAKKSDLDLPVFSDQAIQTLIYLDEEYSNLNQ
jgi:hypothetical protein